jgi:serine/threonine protein kinase/ketosteroid isomerase-like protein
VPGGLEAGETFGDFEIVEVAGEGGMGVVYRARQITLERIVALKVIAPHVANAPDFTDRFRRESRLAASIDHPHVVSVHSAGELEGRAYIAMQWIDGVGLDALLTDGQPLPEARTRRIVSQIAGALDVAHSKGLVHRDVKPPNVLVRSIGGADHAYLTDFGIARRTDVGASGITKTGQTVGTVGYMAPEQIRGEPSDGRADVYSLGCVLFQCLTGRRPFEHETDVATMFAHVNEERPRPSAVRPELAHFDDVVVRALALDPDERFATGAELAEALAAAGSGRAAADPTAPAAPAEAGETRTAVTRRLPEEPPPPSPPPTPPPPRPAHGPRRPETGGSRRVLAGLGIVLLVAAIGLGAFAAAGGFESDPDPTTPASSGGGESTTGSGTEEVPITAADSREISGVLDEYATAYTNQDSATMASLFAPDATRFGASDAGCRQSGVDEIVAAYESQWALGAGSYSLSDEEIEGAGDAATVDASYLIGGTPGNISFELIRSGDEWLIDHVQAPCAE